MKNFVFLLIILFFISCEESQIQKDSSIISSLEYQILNELEQAELLSSKIIAYSIATNKNFKYQFLNQLFHKNGYPNEDVFLNDIITNIPFQNIEELMSSMNKNEVDFNSLKAYVKNNNKILVAKVPLWFGSLWHLTDENEFNINSSLLKTIKVIPNIVSKKNYSTYFGYEFNNNSLKYSTIDAKNSTYNFLPIIIRISEYHKAMSIDKLLDNNDSPVLDSLNINLGLNHPCNTKTLLRKHKKNTILTSDVVNWVRFQIDFTECTRKNQDNNLKQLTLTSEICGNGIDDDSDGLIDINDPDCCLNNTRDCVEEENIYASVKFENNYVGLFHNSAPPFNDIIGLEILSYELITGNNTLVNMKQIFRPFLKICDSFSINPINSSYNTLLNEAFYSASWTTQNDPPNYLGISYYESSTNNNYYLNLYQPLIVNMYEKWANNWDTRVFGDRVMAKVLYLSSDLLNNNLAEIKSLGTFDMLYDESNRFYQLEAPCIENNHTLNVTSHSTGAVEVWTTIK